MDDSTVCLGIIGCGRWGINHVKTAQKLLGDEHVFVADASAATQEKIRAISPGLRWTMHPEDLIANDEINAVVIATPAETHYAIARQCLDHHKHVLVEKPITLHTDEARELVELARALDRRLMVGHVLLYHPAVIAMKRAIQERKIGTLEYIYSNRLNLGTIRSEENILWSFAPHDISIIQYFTGTKPLTVEAHGAGFLQKRIEDTTLTYLRYPNNVHAHIFVSWLHPFKEQRLVVVGDEGMLVFEDSLPKDKLKFFHKGYHTNGTVLEKFDSEFELIPYEDAEPLAEEHRHFYTCIQTNTTPLTDGVHALDVLEILEQATRRLQND